MRAFDFYIPEHGGKKFLMYDYQFVFLLSETTMFYVLDFNVSVFFFIAT